MLFFAVSLFATSSALASAPQYAPDNIYITNIDYTSITLSWTAVGADPAISGYRIDRESPFGAGFTTIVANTGSTNTTYTNTGLSSGVTYSYRVAAVNGDGVGPYTSVAIYATTLMPSFSPPARPTLTATALSGSEVRLDWIAPFSGQPITGYKIERGMGTGYFDVIVNVSSTVTMYKDTNLSGGVTYIYRVSAFTDYGSGEPSSLAFATTFLPPLPPQNVKALPLDGAVLISWAEPASNGGGTISSYVVEWGTTSSINVYGSSTNITVRDLENGVPYYFAVSAVNAAGTSAPARSNVVIPVAGTAVPQNFSTSTASATQGTAPPLPFAANSYVFRFSLRKGMKNNAVYELQKRLSQKGFLSVSPTGYFGALTEAAVKKYQNANFISPTGTAGPLTRAYLNAGF